MRLKSKIDGKIYNVYTFETYTDDLGLTYTTEDGSESWSTGYSSLAEINKYWEDVEDE